MLSNNILIEGFHCELQNTKFVRHEFAERFHVRNIFKVFFIQMVHPAILNPLFILIFGHQVTLEEYDILTQNLFVFPFFIVCPEGIICKFYVAKAFLVVKTILNKGDMLWSQIVQILFGCISQNDIFEEAFNTKVRYFKMLFEILFGSI